MLYINIIVMKRILVPTDFSKCADNALNLAVRIATLLPADITLVHTVESVTEFYIDYMGVQKEQEEELLSEARTKLRLLEQSIRETEHITINAQLYTGSKKENILTAITDTHADLVVMGTMGTAGGIGSRIWGSKTASITGDSVVPVIAVPYDYSWIAPNDILFATNHFERDTTLLTTLFEIAALFKSGVHAVVFTDEESGSGADFVDHTRGMESYDRFLQQTFPGQKIIAAHISGDGFEETLQLYIEENNIGMIAMVSQQRGLLSRIIHPSATRSMTYHATMPLLILPGFSTRQSIE